MLIYKRIVCRFCNAAGYVILLILLDEANKNFERNSYTLKNIISIKHRNTIIVVV